MSVRVLSKAMRDSRAELGARLVAFALADSAHDDGVTWAGQAELAAKTLLSERHVRRAIEDLIALGELSVAKVQRGRRRVNVYRLLFAGLPEPDLDRMPAEIADALRPDIMSGGQEDGRPDISDRDDRTFPLPLARAGQDRGLKSFNRKENRKIGTAIAVPAQRPRNLVYDAVAEACQVRPQLLDSKSPIYDKDAAREVGVAQASIREKARGLPDDALAEEVALRARAYRQRWPDIDLTPSALAKHWNRVVTEAPRHATRSGDPAVTQADMDRLIAEAGRREQR